MFRNIVINKYIAQEFFKIIVTMSFGFLCLGFIINLFEEINLFKDFDVGIEIPILLSFPDNGISNPILISSSAYNFSIFIEVTNINKIIILSNIFILVILL